MRTLGLLLVVLGITYLPAGAQETDAPQGALIEAADVSGIRLDQLSPGLRKDIEPLANTTLDRGALDELASRIEEELPDAVTAVRAVSRPAGAARVVFLVARISDDADLVENINTRATWSSAWRRPGASWNVSRAARLLAVERTNLHKRIRALGLSRE
jgi:hypothetical protein